MQGTKLSEVFVLAATRHGPGPFQQCPIKMNEYVIVRCASATGHVRELLACVALKRTIFVDHGADSALEDTTSGKTRSRHSRDVLVRVVDIVRDTRLEQGRQPSMTVCPMGTLAMTLYGSQRRSDQINARDLLFGLM